MHVVLGGASKIEVCNIVYVHINSYLRYHVDPVLYDFNQQWTRRGMTNNNLQSIHQQTHGRLVSKPILNTLLLNDDRKCLELLATSLVLLLM